MGAQICPTDRMRKLLVATDGSESCRGAEREAIHLARTCSSKLVALLVVVTNREYEGILPWVVEQGEREMQAQLDSVKAVASRKGLDCEIVLQSGEDPGVTIVDGANRSGADLILMGTRARTGLRSLLMGSPTGQVISHAHTPVLVIKLSQDERFQGQAFFTPSEAGRVRVNAETDHLRSRGVSS